MQQLRAEGMVKYDEVKILMRKKNEMEFLVPRMPDRRNGTRKQGEMTREGMGHALAVAECTHHETAKGLVLLYEPEEGLNADEQPKGGGRAAHICGEVPCKIQDLLK